MHMDVDGADQRRIGKTEIDRPAHRVDFPIVKLDGLGRRLPGLLTAARAVGTKNHEYGNCECREPQYSEHARTFCETVHHDPPCHFGFA